MINIFLFTQNLKLSSLFRIAKISNIQDTNVFLTTHFLFDNERDLLSSIFSNCIFKDFADYLTDSEMESCDTLAYSSVDMDYYLYLSELKRRKNILVAEKVLKEYGISNKYILSDDLGIDVSVWKKYGFKSIKCEYYYSESSMNKLKQCAKKIPGIKRVYKSLIDNKPVYNPNDVYVGYSDGKKYVFIGKMSRIDYRLNIRFDKSKEECDRLNKGLYETKDKCTYMTTWHEHGKCQIPDKDIYSVRWTQDGYLPPNYTHKDYCFKPNNVIYYCWDVLGTQLFKNQNLPYEIIPFRKKLYLPKPKFPKEVKRILIVASGSGDWTALKNRSDDDIMVDAFSKLAKKFPEIQFVYRCHPTWVHPQNVGVNAINRVHDYFNSLNLNNLSLSSNMPLSNVNGEFQFSYSRSSLEEDLLNSDIVFGEHSISMIDAAFKEIPFCSVNLTNRRNFFVGINDLGFPSCVSIDEIIDQIERFKNPDYQATYLEAIERYNLMTAEG